MASPTSKYLYLEPKVKTKTAITGVLVLIVITVIIMNYLHIYLNWNTVKCRVENIYLAYITGAINKKWKEDCIK